MTPREPSAPAPRGADRCPACDASLAHDQRYCVHCGTRRGSPPPQVLAALREIAGQTAGAAQTEEGPAPGEAPDSEPEPERAASILPLARAAAVSILLMLGLGAVFGAALRPGGVTSLARDIVVVVHHPAAPTQLADTGSTGGGSGSTSGSGAETVTVTETTGGGGSSGSAGASTPGSGGSSGSGTGSGAGGSGSGSGSGGSGSGAGNGPQPATKLPSIGHVWEIVLSGQGYSQSFGTTAGHPYLSKTLVDQGELITQYDAVAGSQLANEAALISGQGPTEQTITNCPTYADITPGTTGKLGQVLGSGCLYPASTQTLGQQLQIDGLSWRAYIQGIGSSGQRHPGTTTTGTTTTGTATTPTTSSTTTTSSSSTAAPLTDTSTAAACPHPAEGAADGAQAVGPQDDYVTWKNPWVYFHSAVDDQATCAKEDVGLAQLAKDLRSDGTTPSFSYIAPGPCDDGSDTPCRPGAKAGLARADAFLRSVVPEIERSAAYKTDGLILITFDEAPQSGPDWSTASCCGEPTFPNLPAASTSATTTTSSSSTSSTTPTSSTTTSTTPPTPSGCPTTTSTTTPTTPTTTSTTTTGTTTTTSTTSDCTPAITGDPPGGGQVGLLMISPYVKPHTLNTIETYNHFSLLKSIENLFGVPHLGYAAATQVPSFIPSLFLAQKR